MKSNISEPKRQTYDAAMEEFEGYNCREAEAVRAMMRRDREKQIVSRFMQVVAGIAIGLAVLAVGSYGVYRLVTH